MERGCGVGEREWGGEGVWSGGKVSVEWVRGSVEWVRGSVEWGKRECGVGGE